MIYWWKDSAFAEELKQRLNTRATDETLVSFFLYLNIAASCAVVAAWHGLSINAIIGFVLFTYLGLLTSLAAFILLYKRAQPNRNLPHFALAGDAILLSLISFNEWAESALSIPTLCLILLVATAATLVLARVAFVQFAITKTLIFILLIIMVVSYAPSANEALLTIFLMIVAYLIMLVNAYWLYLSRIRQLDKTLNMESLSQRLKIEQNLSERLFVFIGHDLRQPLNGIDMLLFSLGTDSPAINQVREGVRSAKRLIDNILQIATYRAEEITVEKTSIILSSLFNQIKQEFHEHAHAKNVDLRVVYSSLAIYADKDLLGRTIKNLIDNAISHTQSAKVLMGVRRRENGVAIWIVDQGQGLSQEVQQQLSTDSPIPMHGSGFGLGLLIAREFIKANDGQLHIRAIPGQGSTVELFFPIPLCHPYDAPVTRENA